MDVPIRKTTSDPGYRILRSGRRGISQIDHKTSQLVSKRNLCERNPYEGKNKNRKTNIDLKIDTWNVKLIYEAGKVHDFIREMQRLYINMRLGLNETI